MSNNICVEKKRYYNLGKKRRKMRTGWSSDTFC